MSTAALFTRAKTWKQPKCQSVDKWTKKMWNTHTHTQWNVSHKKNEILPFAATRMDLENITLNEISQRKTNTV